MTNSAHQHLAICITVFRPDTDLLHDLLAAIDPSFLVILHIDGPTGEAICADQLAALTATDRYRILQAPCNRGIGAALNRMVAEAQNLRREWVLFFDQDSAPAPDLPEKLLAAFSLLRKDGHHPAVVGPTPVADEGEVSKPPSYRGRSLSSSSDRYRAVDYVITSGSLIRLSAIADIGLFREEYRMDAIDTEWCFRAWATGYSVWHVRDIAMQHRVGVGVIQFGPIRFPRQNCSRMQSYARNQFHLLRLGHVPMSWKLRTVVYVPLQIVVFIMQMPGHRVRYVGKMMRSLWEGLSGRLGQSAARDRPRD